MTERTPPRGNLTRALAKRMREEQASVRPARPSSAPPAAPPDDDTVPRIELPKPPASAPAPRPRPLRPAATVSTTRLRAAAAVPAARAPDDVEQRWDEDTPAPMWISASPAAPAWSMPAAAPAPAPASVPPSLPPPLPLPSSVAGAVHVPQAAPAAVKLPQAWSQVALEPPIEIIDEESMRPASGLARKLGIALGVALLLALAARALWPALRPQAQAVAEPAAESATPAPVAVAVAEPAPAAVAVAAPALPSPALPSSARPEPTAANEDEEDAPARTERSSRELDEVAPSSDEVPAHAEVPSPANPPTAAVEVPATEVLRLTPKPQPAPATSPTSPAVAAVPAPSAAAPAAKPPAPVRGPSREAFALEQVIPKFPARARRLDVAEGTVDIAYTVDTAGAVRDAVVVSAEPAGVFDEAALNAIQRWRFSPKLQDGKPVPSRKRFKFTFR